MEAITLGEVTIERAVLQTEQGTEWFVAYTDVPGSTISYCFYLNLQEFTEEAFLEDLEKIQLQEYSIY
ncbi:MAG: hypothetical protein IIX45_04090 [Lachnospiraceae bacterium]|nr:hypothetical protein [Lachnospiraceae bacterium]MBQ2406874.1 hypothetical protein [Lachnospiraceae bacterium]